MKHRNEENSKPISPEDRILIPPNTCRCPTEKNASKKEDDHLGNAMVLPSGSLRAWLRLQRRTAGKFTNEELGRFARQLVRTGQDVNRVMKALVAADDGMFPPPEIPPTDPGGNGDESGGENGDEHVGFASKSIIPIKDNELAIARPVFDQIAQQLQYRGREEAGLLLGPKDTQLVTLFVRDKLGTKTASSFMLHTATLNETIQAAKDWNLELLAIIHCHPDGVWRPSGGDIRYVRDLFAHPNNGSASQFFMPLVVSGRLLPYLLFRDEPDRVVRARLKIIG